MTQASQTTDLPGNGGSANAGADLTGRTLADFRIIRQLGQGGFGQVYLAEQISLKRPVALKILKPELATNAQAMQRFEAEAKAAARAVHANIVQVYAFGVADGIAYLAMEYVEGRNLREHLARKGPPELLVALSIMRQVAMALQRASELGITHRDIKPENILLTRKVEVKVADFGLARCLDGVGPALHLTQSGVTMGTPLYMSPEQVEGKPVDPRSDIYSFGVTCYHVLAGQPPYHGETAFEVALQHVRSQPRLLTEIRPDLPESICAVIHKMMARDPEQRYQTGRELLRDLQRVREGLSGQTTAVPLTISVEPLTLPTLPTQPIPLPLPPPQARPGQFWVFALLLLTLPLAAGGGALFAWVKRGVSSPTAASPGAADVAAVDAVCLPSKVEESLRGTVEQYLSGDKHVNPANGFGPCVELGLLYLDAARLDEAQQLFTRLSKHRAYTPYEYLGHLGLGIVLALRDDPQGSLSEFNLAFPAPVLLKGPAGKGKASDRAQNERPFPHPLIGQLFAGNSRWRFWVVRALWFDLKNGGNAEQVPHKLKNYLQAARGAVRKT